MSPWSARPGWSSETRGTRRRTNDCVRPAAGHRRSLRGGATLPRLPLTVRDAVADDSPALLELWADPLVPLAADPVSVPDVELAAQAVVAIGNDPFSRIVVAEHEHDGERRVVGAVYLRRAPIS